MKGERDGQAGRTTGERGRNGREKMSFLKVCAYVLCVDLCDLTEKQGRVANRWSVGVPGVG